MNIQFFDVSAGTEDGGRTWKPRIEMYIGNSLFELAENHGEFADRREAVEKAESLAEDIIATIRAD